MLNGAQPYKHSTLTKTPQHGEIVWKEICPVCKEKGTLKKHHVYSCLNYCTNCRTVFYPE
jgi:hypothetical protein